MSERENGKRINWNIELTTENFICFAKWVKTILFEK